MFDIGFFELVTVFIVMLLVIGPEQLPTAARTLGLWFGRIKRSFNTVRKDIEDQLGIDDVRRQLHNESILKELGEQNELIKASVAEDINAINTLQKQTNPSDEKPKPSDTDAKDMKS